MKKILVSMMSEHIIPNILAAAHFRPDELLVFSTEEMEKKGKTKAFLSALKRLDMSFVGTFPSAVVVEDSIMDCHRKMAQCITGMDDAEFIVNLTCGTKMMSIAAYEHFKDYGAKMIYVPFPKNEFITPFPKRLKIPQEPLSHRLDVLTYLAAYGLKVTNENKLVARRSMAIDRKQIAEWIAVNYDKVKNMLEWFGGILRNYRNARHGYSLNAEFKDASEHEQELLVKMGFKYANSIVSKHMLRPEIGFVTGDWLEDYCFNEVNSLLSHGVDDVVVGLTLRNKEGGENEFDVMFTCNNALYFVECKSLDQLEDSKHNQALYKIGALGKDFGLQVKSFLLTTAPGIMKDGNVRPSVQARADQFRTTIIPPGRICDFLEILREKLGLQLGGNTPA